jgi:crotonobetainyl-CoA:carnitine CoA-transferase CaiB-like acyl-CoA transferase
VDYKALSLLNPRLIYASITGFGTTSSRPAYDLILQAESGFMFMNGEHGSKALKMPVALIDLLAGHQLKEAVLIALLQRSDSGKGMKVEVSLFQSAVASLANQATNWLVAKQLPVASGSLHPNIAPYGELFDTRDKHLVTFAIGSNKQFRGLCEVIEYPALAAQPKFATNHSRVTNRNELYSLLYNYVKQFDFALLYERCLAHNVPVGKIRNLREVFALPEAKEMLRKHKHGAEEVTTVSGIAFRLEE